MDEQELLLAFLQKMVDAGLLTGDEVLADDVVENILGYLRVGDEGRATAVVQQVVQRAIAVKAGELDPNVAWGAANQAPANTPNIISTQGRLFQYLPVGTNKETGEILYDWKDIAPAPKTPLPAWQVTKWVEDADGNVVGYYDQSGVPQSLDKDLLPRGERGITPSEQLARERFDWEKQQDVNDQAVAANKAIADREAARRAEANEAWAAAQGYEQAYAKTMAKEATLSEKNRGPWLWPEPTARNWLETWKRGNAPVPATRLDVQAGLRNRLSETDLALLRGRMGTNIERGTVWDPSLGTNRPETEVEYNRRITEEPIRRLAEGQGPANINTTNMNSPFFIPTNEDQQNKYDQLVAWGLAQGNVQANGQREVKPSAFGGKPVFGENVPLGTGWTPEAQAALEVYMKQYGTRAPGPRTPDYLKGVTMSQQGRVNLKTLGGTGNVVRPVSAQMWENWSPSQREGYVGLVGAQRIPRQSTTRVSGRTYEQLGQGVDVPDYLANVEKMWGASKRGQLAQRRPRSY